ncbi:DUF6544 family protein [Devosia sp. FJ2-5-3]|uniref:DUF6544 family protein n=1 Tax=Devosia sp. FJ2-5-3 TaxID=2976680 RepID=UPI0023D8044A|nr:DUF6544 family protein [Devosia sp. FJ2-5-3]WEJ56887.1 hypothetical protein N0P34_11735 [Devosia sp. FJ2-5-3]
MQTLIALAVVALFVAGAVIYLNNQGRQMAFTTSRLVRELSEAPASTSAKPLLPQLVRDYALRAGGRIDGPAMFRARQSAVLVMKPGGAEVQLLAEQWTSTLASGFVWVAEGRMFGLPVRAVDAYTHGRGHFGVQALGAFPIARGRGVDFDKGELMRYLSELPIYPDAILNNSELSWREIRGGRVEVTGRLGTGSATVRFGFDREGNIVSMQADDRPRSVGNGRTVPTRWFGSYGMYETIGAYRIPTYGEVAWMLSEGSFTYWRGTLISCEPVSQD